MNRDVHPARPLALALLIVFAVGICLWYGRFGLNPLDQSIVFDGGWRILSGQLPFRDFTTPVGLVPILMQAAIFKTLGVTWFAYCLHASLINALFAIVVLLVARRLGAGFWTAWLTAIASAVVFYPPIGVPFSEQHSFFFSVCCLWTTLISVQETRTAGEAAASRRALVATPSIAGLALLSKLVPAGFIVGPCVVAMVAVGLRKSPRATIVGLLLPVALGGLAVAAIGVPLRDVAYAMIVLPLHTATARTVLFPLQKTDASVALRLHYIVPEWTVLLGATQTLVVGLWLGAAAFWIAQWARIRTHVDGEPLRLLSLSVWLMAATAAFAYVTNNAISNGVALVPLCAVLAWLAFSRAMRNLTPSGGPHWRTAHAVLAALVLLAAASDTWTFNEHVNAARALTRFDRKLPRWSPGGRLQYLRMQRWTYRYDLRDILPYIASRPDNFMLFGDAALLYGATGHPSTFPALWMHPGLTIPAEAKPFEAFEDRVLENVSKYHVRYFIQEDNVTHMGAALDYFHRVVDLVDGCPIQKVGDWSIRELCK